MPSALPPKSSQPALARSAVAGTLFKSRVLNPVHLNQVGKHNFSHSNEFSDVVDSHLEEKAVDEKKSTVKHWKEKNTKYEMKCGYQYNGPYHGVSSKHYQHKRSSERKMKSTVKCIRAPDLDPTRSKENLLRTQKPIAEVRCPYLSTNARLRNVQPSKKIPPIPSRQLLLTKKATTTTKPNIAARIKDLRLKGSDLYVARLGSCNVAPPLPPQSKSKYVASSPDPPSPKSSPNPEPSSLYDELSPLSRTPSPPTVSTAKATAIKNKPEIRASRPCYRCMSAMHAVGIKRVFWTNADGEWEGAKVRELVEALEMGGGEPGHDDSGDKGIFVTKHEVLMLKRMMGL